MPARAKKEIEGCICCTCKEMKDAVKVQVDAMCFCCNGEGCGEECVTAWGLFLCLGCFWLPCMIAYGRAKDRRSTRQYENRNKSLKEQTVEGQLLMDSMQLF